MEGEAPSLPPPRPSTYHRALEPLHVDTNLSSLLRVLQPPINVDTPFPRTQEPPSQMRQDSLVAPDLVGLASSFLIGPCSLSWQGHSCLPL